MPSFKIGDRSIGDSQPTYFVADIGANHDGSLDRARKLVRLAKDSGADAVKFQNFRASKIVSNLGFESLPRDKMSHQSTWKRSVFEVYSEASISWDWTPILKSYCEEVKIDYFSTPYDLEAVDMLDPFVLAYKIGSGDITWLEIIKKIAEKRKPVILSSGASDISDVQRAVHSILEINSDLALLQCNTNYNASPENLNHIHLNVLKTYRVMFPSVVLGLSDHTFGHSTVLGAVALGARIIEKHFTDDNNREGPDHLFAMNPKTWREMVEATRELESALGDTEKVVAENEQETVVVQRRCLRAARDLKSGTVLTRGMIDVLRPAPNDAILPYDLDLVLGKSLAKDLPKGQHFTWNVVVR